MAEKRYAVLIGSSKYSDKSGLQNLRCPENDVIGLREILAAKQFGGFDDTVVCVNEPHYEILLRLGEVFERAGGEDLVLIYFSGHGKQDLLGNLYLTTTNTLSKSLSVTSIPVEQLRQLISTSRTKKVVLILDCCYSGAAEKAFLKGEAGDELSRVAQAKAKGTYILTASTQIQAAIEKEGDKYGLLTKYIIEGIRDGGAARDDGLVSMDSLYDYVSEQVGDEGPQQPMHWALGAVGDELVIATGGSPTGAARRVRIKKVLPELQYALPDDVFLSTTQLVETPGESLSLEQQQFDRLLDLLLEKPPRVTTFVNKWRLEEKLNLTAERQRKVTQLYARAEEAFRLQDLQKTIDALEELLEIDSENTKAVEMLYRAREQKTLTNLYDTGKAAYDSQCWAEAVKVFDQISELDQSYRDVADLRQKAATAAAEEMIAHSIAAARQALESDNFASAREQLVKLLAAIPNCNEARELLNETDRGQKLSSLYKQGLDSIEAEQWAQAVDQFNQVRNLDPDYKEVAHFIQFVTEEVEKEEAERLLQDVRLDIKRGEWTNAEEKLLTLVASYPNFHPARRELEFVESQLEITNTHERRPDVDTFWNKIVTFVRTKITPQFLMIGSSALLLLVVIAVFFYIQKRPPSGAPEVVNANNTKPAYTATDSALVLPPSFRDALRSVAIITGLDANGNPVSKGIGFFIKEDEIATAVATIEGAVKCRFNLVGKLPIDNVLTVSRIDRSHRLVFLKIDGSHADPLMLNTDFQFREGEGAYVIKLENAGQRVSLENVTVSLAGKRDFGALSSSVSSENIGTPILNSQGHAVGIIVDSGQDNKPLVTTNVYIRALSDARPEPMTLAEAGANEVLYDLRTDYKKGIPVETLSGGWMTEDVAGEPQHKISVEAGLQHKIISAAFLPEGLMDAAVISSSVQGSFTTAGARQTAYLVDSRSGSHADGWGPKKIVIMEGGATKRIVEAGRFHSILKASDLNKDGVSELLVIHGWSGQGTSTAEVSLVGVSANKLNEIKTFYGLDDNCASALGDSRATVSVIYYSSAANGSWPEFRVDKYLSSCARLPRGFGYVSSSGVRIQ